MAPCSRNRSKTARTAPSGSSAAEKIFPFRVIWGYMTRTTFVGEPPRPSFASGIPSDAASRSGISVRRARILPASVHKRGVLISLTTQSSAGNGAATVSWPPSTARSRTIRPPSTDATFETYVNTDAPRYRPTAGPTCPVSPSVARSPAKMRSNSPAFLTPAARVSDVASVSDPANLRSEIRKPRSHPIAMADAIARRAAGGPIEMTVISPPSRSLRRTASSTA